MGTRFSGRGREIGAAQRKTQRENIKHRKGE